MRNEKAKRRPVDDPYEIYTTADWEWRVLKHYESEEKENDDPYARVLVACSSPVTREQMSAGYELGDEYLHEIESCAFRLKDTERVAWLAQHEPWEATKR